MGSSTVSSTATAGSRRLSPEEVRWLHDKYERLAAEEGQLAASRTSYFAAIGTVLVTGLVVVIADLLVQRWLLVSMITFLAGLGLLISSVWAVLLHRTTDAQKLWREAALRLEELTPPLATDLPASVTLRSGAPIDVDLARPYQAHARRFSAVRGISWMDRVDPAALMEILPQSFILIWGAVLVAVWGWFLLVP